MLKKTLLAAALVGAVSFAAPAHAADCISNYEKYWDVFQGDAKDLSAETVLGVNRAAVRAFDACQSGDESKFGLEFWEKISGDIKDPEKFWEEMSRYGGAK